MPDHRSSVGKSVQTFSLDTLPTPIGTALLVSDDDGVLRALDWEDYEPRMTDLLRRQYGQVALKEMRAPAALANALTAYFKGDLDRLAEITWRVAGTPFQQKVWSALTGIPAGRTMSYGAAGGTIADSECDARGRPCQRRQSDQRRAALPPPDRLGRQAREIRRAAWSASAGCCGTRAWRFSKGDIFVVA